MVPDPSSFSADPGGARLHTMSDDDVQRFVGTRGFGILSLAEGNRAYAAPLFYGAHDEDVYFQTRAGSKSRYLYATTEACLSISGARPDGQWANVQLFGRLERVDEGSRASAAQRALGGVPPPPAWAEDENKEDREGLTTFRLRASRRVGCYSSPAGPAEREAFLGF
jgi:nitroimidazol reductase NimA-like FMN-containing flavoprotein (pyridoxamine 5'-phosphate oxidase superfamily)